MKSRPKIYVNVRFLTQPITGVQRYALEVVKRLNNSEKYDFFFISPKGIIHKSLAKELNVKRFGFLSSHLWEQIELPIYLKRKGSPILLSLCNTSPYFYSKNILTVHDLAFIENPKWFNTLFSKFYRFLIPRLIKKSNKIITVSEFSKNEIVYKLNIDHCKISVAYNGVEHIKEGAKKYKNNKIVEDFFLIVASLDPRKNIQNVVSAFSSKKLSKIKLKIVGGNSRNFANILNLKADNIEYLGRVSNDELIRLYQKAKGFIYPSLYEGFGIPPVEALVHGTLPIVSDIPVFKEVLGDDVIFVDPTSVENIISVVECYLSKEESELHKKLQKAQGYIRKYSWEKTTSLIENLLN